MTDGTSSPEPLAVDPAAGTDASATVDSAVPLEPIAPHRPFWARLDSPFTVGFLLTIGGLAAIVLGVAISNIATVIIYIALAMFAALGLDPVVQWFGRHNVKRPWAIAIVFLAFGIVGAGLVALVVPTLIDQVVAFIEGIPATITNFESSDTYAWLEGIFGPGLTTLVDEVQKFLLDPGNIAAISGGLLKVGVGIATAVSGALIIVVLTLYFVASLPGIKESLMQFAPARNRAKVRSMTNQITESIGGYLMGMVILAFFNSVVAFLLHLFLGLPYPLLMGVLAFSITIIPLVGPVLYWIFATVLALFSSPALRPDLRDRLPDLHPDRGLRDHAARDEQGHLDPGFARGHRRADRRHAAGPARRAHRGAGDGLDPADHQAGVHPEAGREAL